MYKRILVPTDGGEQALAAAHHALKLAEIHDSTVYVVFVVSTRTSWLTVSKSEVRDSLQDVGEDASIRAFEAIETLARGVNVTLHTDIREGPPGEQILLALDDYDIDLIVMGTHGRTGIQRRIIGSVAEQIVRDASIPVLTVKTEDREN